MDQVRSGAIVLSWDSEKRFAFLGYEAEIRATAQDLKPVVEALGRWVGTENEPFFFLNDVGNLLHMDTECRALLREFFRPHRQSAWIALYNLSPFMKIVAEMYYVATGLRIKVFDDEAAARAWLREKGAAL